MVNQFYIDWTITHSTEIEWTKSHYEQHLNTKWVYGHNDDDYHDIEYNKENPTGENDFYFKNTKKVFFALSLFSKIRFA